MADSAHRCPVCGAASPLPLAGIFCACCGMRFRDDGAPCLMPQEVVAAIQAGDPAVQDLAARSGVPAPNIRRLAEMLMAGAPQGAGCPPPGQPSPGSEPVLHGAPPTAGRDTTPPAGVRATSTAEARPRVLFGYDDAFFLDSAGEVVLQTDLEGATGTEQDVKLTVEGDILKPFSVNMQDRLAREVRMALTPNRFPTSRVVVRVSYFDARQEPHCWVGETMIRDVEQHLEQQGGPQIHLQTQNNVGDQEIKISGVDAVNILKRRRLTQPVRCEVLLREDDEAERRLNASAKVDRLKAGELLHKARRRVDQHRLEDAYKLLREVEELGFSLREVQALRSKIERELSQESLLRGRHLFAEGKLREAFEFLSERKLLCFNQEILDLLLDIEDIGETCQKASTLVDEGRLDEAEKLVEGVRGQCPVYERANSLLERIRGLRSEKLRLAEADALERQRQEEEERAQVRRKAEEEARTKALQETESRICEAAEEGRWRQVFDELGPYARGEGHDERLVADLLGRYVAAARLRPLAKLIPPGDEDPHLLLVGEPELPVGRHESNAVILNDSTCRTSRSHGRIIMAAPGTWAVQRATARPGAPSHVITVNDHALDEGEGVEILDGDRLAFADTVVFQARVPETPVGRGVELSVVRLPEGDEDYLNLMRWTILEGAVLAGGGDDCHVRLPGVSGAAFVLVLSGGIFWIEPAPGGPSTVTVAGEALEGPRPLYHRETVAVGGSEFLFYQLRQCEELWQWDDELDGRGLP